MPWRSEGWQGEQAGRFPGDAGAGLPTSWERKGPSVWPQSCQRAAGQRLQQKRVAVTQSSPRRQELPVGGTQAQPCGNVAVSTGLNSTRSCCEFRR